MMKSSRRRLLVYTRYPRPGEAKTRLISKLGPEGAADLQRRMTRHALAAARRWQADGGHGVEVRFAGGDEQAMRHSFGHDLMYVPQAGATLGERLYDGFQSASRDGCDAVVAIGADCPDLDETVLEAAFRALRDHDLVIGPATDGGYYLIGLRRPIRELFADIDWGTPRVLAQTRAAAEHLGLKVSCLMELADVDKPDDVSIWDHAARRTTVADGVNASVSVIIPTIDEAGHLAATLASIGASPRVETIVADGGSRDATLEVARSWDARVVQSLRGRAVQMNAGAQAATGEILLFLHADTRLPVDYLPRIETCLADRDIVAGAFRLGFDHDRPGLRLVAAAANLRSVYRQLPYGDQGIFLRRTTFSELGGFRPLPIMEDYDLVTRLRRRGRIGIVPSAVITSARRCLDHGLWRTTLAHQCIILGWRLGINADRLARWRRHLIGHRQKQVIAS